MRGFVTTPLSLVVFAVVASMCPRQAPAADAPANRVIVMYFHRTERCPTCLKMGDYSEEAIQTGFAKPLESGAVGFYYIDFQDEKNARLAKAYGISGPALIVGKVVDNKVVKFSNLKDIWTQVREKKAFLQYVQDTVTSYLELAPRTAATARQTR